MSYLGMHRETELKKLKDKPFDLLIIGGGATGTGIALEAASRGLKAALIEKQDFASHTSSKSTKLIHGGVRYLEQAVLKFDRSQFKLVRDALRERAILLKIAPHVVHPLPLLTPIYTWAAVPYYLSGLKLYDRLSGKFKIHKSEWLDAKKTLKLFPQLRKTKLKGSVLYYDGQFDDSRMNILIARTAHDYGATLCNYVEAIELLKAKSGKLNGALVRDCLSGETWGVSAKVVINATGPQVDTVRKMDQTTAQNMVKASSGVHIVLDAKFCAQKYGLLVPKTEDGRVLFILPWQGYTLIGTTDNPANISDNPQPTASDIDYLIAESQKYFSIKLSKSQILSSWCGLRPLISNPGTMDTAKLSRDHEIQVSKAGLITIAGGKWTTYRRMGEDTVNHAIDLVKLKAPEKSQTPFIKIKGAEKFSLNIMKQLHKKYSLPIPTCEHFMHNYGDQSEDVLKMAPELNKPLSRNFPYLKCEIIYAVRKEQARKLADALGRRIRLAFLDFEEAKRVAPETAELMGSELGWSEDQIRIELEEFKNLFKISPK